MRVTAWLVFVLMATTCLSSARAQNADDELRVYAVNVVKTPPLEKQFTGFGIYLGKGMVLTAAHVVGHWPAITKPRVVTAGLDLPAEVSKIGSLEDVDLALLSVDESKLPVSLRLRRNPICRGPAPVGTYVIVAYPERTARSRVISPFLIAPQYRARLPSLIAEPQGSGSGVFHAERRCLLGIMSQRIRKYDYRRQYGRLVTSAAGYAGYFVPASTIANFIPPELRF